jgi:cytoskeleton protein RodZ
VSIGQTLSAARRQAGLTVEDISAKTRLRATVVRAIEADEFSLCGGDFYARGHIRTLASLVGLDPAPLLAEYDATIGRPDDLAIASQIYETEAGGRAITRKTERRAPNWGAAAIAAVLVAVIAIAGTQLLNHGKNGAPSAPSNAQGAKTPTPASSPTPTTATSTLPATTPTQSPPATPPSSALAAVGVSVQVKITTAKCWVLATGSTGQVLYQGVLNPGDNQSFVDPQQISLKLGNAPATDLTVNGVNIGAPPTKNTVASLHFGPGNPTLAQG